MLGTQRVGPDPGSCHFCAVVMVLVLVPVLVLVLVAGGERLDSKFVTKCYE